MKLASKSSLFIFAAAALVLAGCSKKPDRPTPLLTAPMGNSSLPNTPVETGLPPGLEQRTDDFGADGQNRAALAANTVYFDFDASAIKASERDKLKAAKDYLDENPTYRLILEGHCDWRGTAEYNLGLGDRRAGASKQFVLKLGVDAKKLETLSKGSLDAVKNGTAEQMGNDRRVDLVILKK